MLTLLAIILTAATVSTFLAFLAAKRDGDYHVEMAHWLGGAGMLAHSKRQQAAQHYTEARRYLLVSSVSAVAALIAWAVLVVA